MISAGISRETRRYIYARDGYRCALCDSTRYLQIHHAIPRGQGGSRDSVHNLVTVCADCHALAHGTDLRGIAQGEDVAALADDVRQAIVEYLADMYAPEWRPYASGCEPWKGE